MHEWMLPICKNVYNVPWMSWRFLLHKAFLSNAPSYNLALGSSIMYLSSTIDMENPRSRASVVVCKNKILLKLVCCLFACLPVCSSVTRIFFGNRCTYWDEIWWKYADYQFPRIYLKTLFWDSLMGDAYKIFFQI